VPQRPEPAGGDGTGLQLVPRRIRWAPSRRAVVGVATVLLVAVLVAVLLVWRAQPSAEAAPVVLRDATPSAGPAAATPSAGATGPPAEVVVHVVGAVRRPGLVRLPAGSRVADAVAAAGGAAAGARAASVNLARVLVDGEQIAVQSRAGPPIAAAPGAAAGPPGASSAGPVDLNTATLEALDGLPGIGPVLAQRILDWRTAHGRFSSVDELNEVSGIGAATLSDLRPAVTV
jgi:competence protein ComEA